MAERWPNNPAPGTTSNPADDPLRATTERLQVPELPEKGTPAPMYERASSQSLNRSAERVGRGVGTAVAEARRLPGRLRSGIHVVSGRGRPLKDTAVRKAEELRRAAESGVAELTDSAERYTSDLGRRVQCRLDHLRRQGEILRLRARWRMEQARGWRPEDPLRVIGICAGAAFLAGVTLRIWRSGRDY